MLMEVDLDPVSASLFMAYPIILVFGTIVESKTVSMSFISTHSLSIYLFIHHLYACLLYIHSIIHLLSNVPIHPTSIYPQSFIHSCIISCPIYLLSIFLSLSYPSIYPTTHGPVLSQSRLQACLLWQILPIEMLINVNQILYHGTGYIFKYQTKNKIYQGIHELSGLGLTVSSL